MSRERPARKAMPSWTLRPTARPTLSPSGGPDRYAPSDESELHDKRVCRRSVATLVIGRARGNWRKPCRFVERARRRIVDSDLEKQGACAGDPRAIDHRGKHGPPGAAALTGRADGKRQQLRLVGGQAPKREADIAILIFDQQAGDARRSQQLGYVLARPGAFAKRGKRRRVQPGGPIEVTRAERAQHVGIAHSTVRRAPSGRVMLTPRR